MTLEPRLQIHEEYYICDDSDISCHLADYPLDEVITKLTEIKEKLAEHTDIRFEVSTSGYYDSISPTITISYKRLETDEEYNRRVKKIEQQKENAKALKAQNLARQARNERETYERLKAKFEPK